MGNFVQVTHRIVVVALIAHLAACGSGSGSSGGGGDDGSRTTVSGQITFDRVPLDADGALDFDAIETRPARQVVVEAVRASGSAILASTTTDASGNYSLDVPANTNIFIRAKAQMRHDGAGATWTFNVRNNTNENRLYGLVGSTFNSGSSPSTRNLHARTGWTTGSGYTETRAAAPFAILDTIFQAKELLRAAQPSLSVDDELDIYWSDKNIGETPGYCPADGRIGTTSFVDAQSNDNDCSLTSPTLPGIYVLGSVAGNDTDEFDQHVIAHEFGHYVEARIVGRSDSIGGEHGGGDRLDPRVAFGEGWGNAFAAMVLDDPVYKDSSMAGPLTYFDLENSNVSSAKGWFSEMSVGRLLWDLFDGANEPDDPLELGFSPLFSALSGPHKATPALTTIYSFMAALRAQNPSYEQQFRMLEANEDIGGRGEFVDDRSEDNNGGNPNALPLYREIEFPQGIIDDLCTDASAGKHNKLNNRRFVRMTLPSAALVTIHVSAQGATQDPDLVLWRRGERVAVAEDVGTTDMIPQIRLEAGDYVIEAYDFAYASPFATGVDNSLHCMTLSVVGG
jgi:hypothetical protein